MAQWDKLSERGKVEDRRGSRMVRTAGSISIAGILMVAALGYMGGKKPEDILMETLSQVWKQMNTTQQVSQSESPEFVGEDSYEIFTSTVLWSNNSLWKNAFERSDIPYKEPKLVLFRAATPSACGGADSKFGPHYCPTDKTIYLDETFFDELQKRYGAQGGDVAEAYVIAHEVAHHIQNLLGTMDEVNSIRRNSPSRANTASVKLELQADCYAGIWAKSIAGRGILEVWEIQEAIDAAEAVGDDHIQEMATGRINPESWTHGSSKQRKSWFMRGYENNNFEMCNTFKS